ncbi:unnamed protein product [Sphagnum troendelagicum]
MARNLVVEVISARDLMPKDGQGSANAYCVLDYGGQRNKTRIVHRSLNPTWNEKFEFGVLDPTGGGELDINVYNDRNSGAGRRSSFLGRVAIPLSSVQKHQQPNEFVRWYPLEKRGLFSNIKGDLGLKIYYGYNQPPPPPPPAVMKPVEPMKLNVPPPVQVVAAQQQMMNPQPPPAAAQRLEVRPDMQPMPMRPLRPLSTLTVPEGEFAVKETNPDLGKAVDYNHHYDLVEHMSYLFIRVVRARGLAPKDANGSSDPYARITVGRVKAETIIVPHTLNPEWNKVFAIGEDGVQGSTVEVTVWDADNHSQDDFLGGLMLHLAEVSLRKPPEPPLPPRWYKLESKTVGNGRVRGEIMVAIWWGTQADEAFQDAWHSDTGTNPEFRSKVYFSPRLWYLRVGIIEAQDLIPPDRSHLPVPYIRAHLGPYQMLRTRPASVAGISPYWNEELIFVVAEPFEEVLRLLVEERIGPKEEILGETQVPVYNIERRINDRPVASRWYVLDRPGDPGLRGRINLYLSLDGGYHVMDESSKYISDTRPTARELWRPPLGILELGIHGANNLLPLKPTPDRRGSTDAYCLAKYGPKWVRTRTIFESFNPRWNEQYTWEVHDPATVITVGVFDNHRTRYPVDKVPLKDLPIGKIRIRLSTLESDRVYTNAYPLLIVTPLGIKKRGEIELAVRLSCASTLNLMERYLQPPLPRMHYRYPLDHRLLEVLRVAAMNIVALRLMRSDPPLRQEVVQFMLDTEAERWSMRKSKANYHRIMAVLGGIRAVAAWFDDICMWRRPITTMLVHLLLLVLVWNPELLLPTLFLYMFLIGAWRYRFRPRTPPFMDAKLSQGEIIGDLDELEEEFNVVPGSRAPEVLKYRYERLRGVAGRIQNALGDLAGVGERVHSLLSWQDPRATAIFITFCITASIILYVTPFQVVAVLLGVYILRHPRFRDPWPAAPRNLFGRLPSQADRIL